MDAFAITSMDCGLDVKTPIGIAAAVQKLLPLKPSCSFVFGLLASPSLPCASNVSNVVTFGSGFVTGDVDVTGYQGQRNHGNAGLLGNMSLVLLSSSENSTVLYGSAEAGGRLPTTSTSMLIWSPLPQAANKESSSPLRMGAAVGGSLAAILLIAGIALLVTRRRKRKLKGKEDGKDDGQLKWADVNTLKVNSTRSHLATQDRASGQKGVAALFGRDVKEFAMNPAEQVTAAGISPKTVLGTGMVVNPLAARMHKLGDQRTAISSDQKKFDSAAGLVTAKQVAPAHLGQSKGTTSTRSFVVRNRFAQKLSRESEDTRGPDLADLVVLVADSMKQQNGFRPDPLPSASSTHVVGSNLDHFRGAGALAKRTVVLKPATAGESSRKTVASMSKK